VYVRRLRRAGYHIVLLDVPDEELLRRHAQRLDEEGWTNVEWFETNKSDIDELRSTGWVDETISGNAPPHEVAATLMRVHTTTPMANLCSIYTAAGVHHVGPASL
jgi:hypothetical protein